MTYFKTKIKKKSLRENNKRDRKHLGISNMACKNIAHGKVCYTER